MSSLPSLVPSKHHSSSCSPALVGLLLCSHLSAHIWLSTLFDLLPHRGNHKPINITQISCSLFFFLISKHLLCILLHNTVRWVLSPCSSEVNGQFYKEASVPYQHFLELCLEFRSAESVSCILSWKPLWPKRLFGQNP